MRVGRQMPSGAVVEYWARVHLEGQQVELEVLKVAAGLKIKNLEFFYATEEIPGYVDWFLISAIPVLLSPRLHWTNNTQILMQFARAFD